MKGTGTGLAVALGLLAAGAGAAEPGAPSLLWGTTVSGAQLYLVDPADGSATLVTTLPDATDGPAGATVLDDTLYGSNLLLSGKGGFRTASIDTDDGATMSISNQGGSDAWRGLASNEEAGVLYSVDGNGILQVLQPDGTLDAVGEPSALRATGLAYDDANATLYAVSVASDGGLFTVSTANGAPTLVGATGVNTSLGAGLAYDENADVLYLNARGVLYTVDVTTGAASTVGNNGVAGIVSLAWQEGEVEMDPCLGCPCLADITGDGVVDTADILELLIGWGDCPDAPRAPGEPGRSGGPAGPAEARLFGIESSDPARVYAIDPETGAATGLAQLDGVASFSGLSFLNGVLYASDVFGYPGESGDIDTATVDVDEGTLTFVTDQDGSFDWHGLASNELLGILYAVDLDAGGRPLKALAPDGTVATIGNTGISARGLAHDDTNGVLYAVAANALYTIDTATGASTAVGPTGVDTSSAGLAYDEDFGVLYMNLGSGADGHALYTVDVETGEATLVGANGADGAVIDGLAWRGSNPCDSCPCAADITRDRVVDTADILELLVGWGECP